MRYQITEAQLRQMIEESVQQAINEGWWSNMKAGLRGAAGKDVQDATTGLKNAANGAWDAVKGAGKAVGNAALNAGKAVGNAAVNAGKAVGSAAGAVKQGAQTRMDRFSASYQNAQAQGKLQDLRNMLKDCMDNKIISRAQMGPAKALLDALGYKDTYYNTQQQAIQSGGQDEYFRGRRQQAKEQNNQQ